MTANSFRVSLDISGPGFSTSLTGPELTGPELTGPELTGPELTGPELTGPELTGPELTGGHGSGGPFHVSLEISGPGFSTGLTGPELTGPELTGPELTGPELTGPELTGSVVDGLGTGGRAVDLPDHRDAPSRHNTGRGSAPALVDLREGWSPVVYDQAQLPACTSNAVAAAIHYVAHAEPTLAAGNPSRMYLYWNERYGSGGSGDVGVTLRQALKTLSAYGSAPADLWPYKPQTLRRNPPREAYARARFVGGVAYERIDLGRDDNPDKAVIPLLRCLAARRPVLFGLSVYDNFRHVRSDGVIHPPAAGMRLLFGHAGLIVGARRVGGQLSFICQNSWGTDWADKGFFYLPAAYVADHHLAQDFWAITQLSG
ncbi:hypothetical protein acdb102_28200 [Acidothermaceae bacterium B102]|nr:hypothetical protein acdb102_28200 [Acidothermaceae bacterium B102]